MDVSPDSQIRYLATDGNGNIHYVECFMCALGLINDYSVVHIRTYCDWYGPDYVITVDSTDYGNQVVVNPATALFLRGGSCVTARAAYNQTAAVNLLANGFSNFTSSEQQYPLPSGTEVKTVNEAINAWYLQPKTNGAPALTALAIILSLGVGAFVVGLTFVTYKKLKSQKK